ncbi:hypothetical protein FACS1894105_12950 [Clostridia bacterium]|nr:hypothetical protein FACS1894105_12950 [Clostridia bacterium]GHV12773.1 hypothetical protein FACS1894219_06340 [Clostridia bacterium]
MKSFLRLFAAVVVLSCILLSSCAEKAPAYSAEYLEKKLSLPYVIEGTLTQNGEKYTVSVESGENFRVKFLSGDVTEGLTVEFFDNGVFLFFDDLRFKTNADAFTSLEALEKAFGKLSAPDVKKYVTDTEPVSGIALIEVAVIDDDGEVRALVNKSDGTVARVTVVTQYANLALDIKLFTGGFAPAVSTYEEQQVYDVVDDYIE